MAAELYCWDWLVWDLCWSRDAAAVEAGPKAEGIQGKMVVTATLRLQFDRECMHEIRRRVRYKQTGCSSGFQRQKTHTTWYPFPKPIKYHGLHYLILRELVHPPPTGWMWVPQSGPLPFRRRQWIWWLKVHQGRYPSHQFIHTYVCSKLALVCEFPALTPHSSNASVALHPAGGTYEQDGRSEYCI